MSCLISPPLVSLCLISSPLFSTHLLHSPLCLFSFLYSLYSCLSSFLILLVSFVCALFSSLLILPHLLSSVHPLFFLLVSCPPFSPILCSALISFHLASSCLVFSFPSSLFFSSSHLFSYCLISSKLLFLSTLTSTPKAVLNMLCINDDLGSGSAQSFVNCTAPVGHLTKSLCK